MLIFDSVGKTFASGTAGLRDFSLSLASGEFVSLVGPSGCGKSTALRLAANLMQPTSGSLAVDQAAQERGAIGLVFQQPTLMPWANVLNNVTMPLMLMGIAKTEREERAIEQLRAVDLQDRISDHPRHLSGGMQMRVSIARALVTRPRLLLMDEPFAALDEITRFALNDDIRALHDTHRLTTLFVTHSIYESVYLSDRVVVMTMDGNAEGEVKISRVERQERAFRHTEYFTQRAKAVADLLASSAVKASAISH